MHSCRKNMCNGTQTTAGTTGPAMQPATQPAKPEPATQPATSGSAVLGPATQPVTWRTAMQPATLGPTMLGPVMQAATRGPSMQPGTQQITPGPATQPATWEPATQEPATQPVTPRPATQPATLGLATQPATLGAPLQPLSTGTVTTLQDPNLDPFTVTPWTLLQEASSDRALQAMEDTMRQFNQAIRTIHHLPALQRACHTLQRLTEGTRLLSEAAQREASESLLFLSTQLLQAPLPSNSSGSAASTPAAISLFQSFSHLLTAMDSSTPTSHWARNQLTEALENTMAALTGIQTVLWEGSCAVESSVTVTSPVASMMLSSRNASTLPRSSYHLAQPVPLTLAFPSASAWAVLLSKHPRVQVRVTVLAVNPFKHLDGKEIRSVGNIFLTANKESIQVQDLSEDIEIRLWRDESTETSSTGLNISTEEFVIEVNVTSMEDALILRVLPDIPLPIELYLGYQHPPNSTHSLLNTTLPTGHGQHAAPLLPTSHHPPAPGGTTPGAGRVGNAARCWAYEAPCLLLGGPGAAGCWDALRGRFVSFYETAQVASALTYLLAFLVALATGKLWNLLRLNPRMHLISSTLRRAWQEVLSFLLVLLLLLAGYSMACNLLFGWSIANYKTFFSSFVTIVGLLIGIFNYDTVINLDPVLGSLLITTSVISMLYVVINLFVSGLLTTFSEERASTRANKDESMMEVMLLKLSGLLGIKQQALQLTRLAGAAEKAGPV
ncbi:hypothetical protein KIL84_005399 [Mauremys mutica]|uniref:Polycystin cation channel PKD1/PKD2 domain-containing protein n=1 Tax=Mauremys mutica TaxID=74926 RepID=A0A9D3XLW4_9SAUR|nr:hypothetical protein KIL84_005399 [Mauremys mutica]